MEPAHPCKTGIPTTLLKNCNRGISFVLNRQDQRDLPLRHKRNVDDMSKKLQLRHSHSILHCLDQHLSLHNDERVQPTPKNCTCGVITVCTVWHCAYLSLCHNKNVQHSADDLNLRDVELEELPELVAAWSQEGKPPCPRFAPGSWDGRGAQYL